MSESTPVGAVVVSFASWRRKPPKAAPQQPPDERQIEVREKLGRVVDKLQCVLLDHRKVAPMVLGVVETLLDQYLKGVAR